MIDGKECGMYLAPDEIKYFPEDSVFPLFRAGDHVFAYQLGLHECPNLIRKNGHMMCVIYENRPLICRSFPLGWSDNGDIIILHDRCTFISTTRGNTGFMRMKTRRWRRLAPLFYYYLSVDAVTKPMEIREESGQFGKK
jgi:Fe-S-cluster containining protein